MRRRLPIIAPVVVVAAAAFLVARPIRWVVEGLSMGPGLMPGDVVASGPLPLLDRWRTPRRFDCWIFRSPDGSTALKRVVGLPGERFGISAGDLAANGRRLLTPPDVLAGIATPVAATPAWRDDGEVELRYAMPVFDEAEFAATERRLLLPVGDVGLAAVVRVPPSALVTAQCVIAIRVGGRELFCRFTRAGRFAIVAGRLDGRLVATAWPVPGPQAASASAAFPPGAPSKWSVADAWADVVEADVPPQLGVRLRGEGLSGEGLTVETLGVWRDVLYRPAADGVAEWQIGPNDLFLLGDFPSGSYDSRQWGPIDASRLLHRVAPQLP